jgi:hypothetical protein
MASAIAVVLPQWVIDLKKTQAESDKAIYRFLPALMQWRSQAYMESVLIEHCTNEAVKLQMREIFEELDAYAGKPPTPAVPWITRITLWSHLPKQLFLSFAPDVKKPRPINAYMLRINDVGLIEEIILRQV